MSSFDTRMKRIRFTSVLLYVIAAIWLAFAVKSLFLHTSFRWIFTFLALGNALLIAWFTYLWNSGRRYRGYRAYWALVILMGANVLLTFTDQVGWADLMYLVPAATAFILLLVVKDKGITHEAGRNN